MLCSAKGQFDQVQPAEPGQIRIIQALRIQRCAGEGRAGCGRTDQPYVTHTGKASIGGLAWLHHSALSARRRAGESRETERLAERGLRVP